MEIRFDNYRVISDRYEFRLEEYRGESPRKKKDGSTVMESRWDCWGHYGTLEELVRAAPQHVLRRTKGTLQDAVKAASALSDKLEQAIKEQGIESER